VYCSLECAAGCVGEDEAEVDDDCRWDDGDVDPGSVVGEDFEAAKER
jgi:hypothetical protein